MDASWTGKSAVHYPPRIRYLGTAQNGTWRSTEKGRDAVRRERAFYLSSYHDACVLRTEMTFSLFGTMIAISCVSKMSDEMPERGSKRPKVSNEQRRDVSRRDLVLDVA